MKLKRNLYITSDNITIKRDGNIIKVDSKKIPLSLINDIFIISNANLTQSARNLLMKNGRSIFFLSKRYELIGILVPDRFDSNYKKRLSQYQKSGNLDLAKYIVNKKISTIEDVTKVDLSNYKMKLKGAESLNEILGFEGKVSTLMFSIFREKLEAISIFDFKVRTYRPVKDRINGTLSFLYTLYYSYLYSEVISEGLDPYVSFLHTKRGTHSAFVSDMMEEARVYLTWLLFNFIEDIYSDGYRDNYLTFEGRRVVLKEFDNFIESYENSLLKEVKEML